MNDRGTAVGHWLTGKGLNMFGAKTGLTSNLASKALALVVPVSAALVLVGCSSPEPATSEDLLLAGPWSGEAGVHKFCDNGRAVYAYGQLNGGIAVVEHAPECAGRSKGLGTTEVAIKDQANGQ